jgi:hypothetical protein
MRIAGLVVAIAIALVLAWRLGWVKPDVLPSQTMAGRQVAAGDTGYRRLYFEPAVLSDGQRTAQGLDAMILLVPHEDKIAACGYVLASGKQAETAAAWLAKARLELGGKRLAADFIRVQPPSADSQGGDIQAGCIATALPWSPDARNMDIALTGLPLRAAP